jgi:hypothetical protein
MMSPSALVPIALGEGKREELRMQDEMDCSGSARKTRERQEELRPSSCQQMFENFIRSGRVKITPIIRIRSSDELHGWRNHIC